MRSKRAILYEERKSASESISEKRKGRGGKEGTRTLSKAKSTRDLIVNQILTAICKTCSERRTGHLQDGAFKFEKGKKRGERTLGVENRRGYTSRILHLEREKRTKGRHSPITRRKGEGKEFCTVQEKKGDVTGNGRQTLAAPREYDENLKRHQLAQQSAGRPLYRKRRSQNRPGVGRKVAEKI